MGIFSKVYYILLAFCWKMSYTLYSETEVFTFLEDYKMTNEQNPIIDVLSWAGFLFAAALGSFVMLFDAAIKRVLNGSED